MTARWMVLALMLALGFGCTGEIADPAGSNAANGGGAGSSGNGNGNGDLPGDDDFFGGDPGAGATACKKAALTVTTRLPRLTHAQYDNSVHDLLGLDLAPSSKFLGDPTFAGFDNSAESLVVSDRLGRDYRRAAEELAAAVIADKAAYAKLVTCDVSDNACAKTFVTGFLRRAFRRPATKAEIDRYTALAARGNELIGSGDAFVDGVQLTVEAALQSPSFLYRTELSSKVGADGYIALTDHEVAARMSYALWSTLPDTMLDAAADSGKLHTPEQVAEQATRMLADERAQDVVANFHRQWLELDNYEDLLRDSTEYPLFTPALAKPMQDETLAFVNHVTFDLKQGVHTLYTAPFTFVNDATAPLYGLTGKYGDAMTRVDLDPTQRSGLLTQLGFLASHAFISTSSPIHRGVFVQRRVLCAKLPDPPGNANLKLPPITGDIKTTRQQVSTHTSAKECQVCHGIINPTGFAFENYDAVGQFRTTDHGEPVDATGSITIDGKSVSYENAIDFSKAIAESDDARACYATQWLRFMYGRQDNAADACTIETIEKAMQDESYSTLDMLTDLTQTRAFLQRAAEAKP